MAFLPHFLLNCKELTPCFRIDLDPTHHTIRVANDPYEVHDDPDKSQQAAVVDTQYWAVVDTQRLAVVDTQRLAVADTQHWAVVQNWI